MGLGAGPGGVCARSRAEFREPESCCCSGHCSKCPGKPELGRVSSGSMSVWLIWGANSHLHPFIFVIPVLPFPLLP